MIKIKFYKLNFEFDKYIATRKIFSVEGLEFELTMFYNLSDEQIYMSIYDNIKKESVLDGIKCIPHLILDEERNYKKPDVMYNFVFGHKYGDNSQDITVDNIYDFDLFLVVG